MTFTDAAWSSPQSNLDASDYCSVCLVDLNESGETKVKAKCKLPVRSRPGGPYNRSALRAAAAALAGARGGVDIPAAEKRRAARRLVRLMAAAGITPGDSIKKLAGGMNEFIRSQAGRSSNK